MKKILLIAVTLMLFNPLWSQESRMAILDLCLRNGETNMENLASVTHIVEAAGIPSVTTLDPEQAFNFPVVLVSSSLRETTLTDSEILAMKNYVAQGGVLIAPFVKNAVLFDLFGISKSKWLNSRYRINFDVNSQYPELAYINDSLEQQISLARLTYYKSIYTRGYTPATCQTLARFEDNTAALTRNTYQNGKAYAFGAEWEDVILRNQINKDYNAHRTYSNGFEPTSDVVILFVKEIYNNAVPFAVTKHSSPGNSPSVLMITHDIDSRTGMDTMQFFSDWEFTQGISAQYFVTTHYFSDGWMSAFYNSGAIAKIIDVKNKGHIIGSHSVGHFPDFASSSRFPTGYPGNVRATYNPAYHNGFTTGGTVFGELEVSRDLLNQDVGVNVRSFRAGHLAFNNRLINVMQTLLYKFNSTHSANDVLTNFPFRQRTNRAFSGLPTNVYELPMTISDVFKSDPISVENFPEKVAIWKDVIERNTANHAPTVLLIHPNRQWKLIAEQMLHAQLSPEILRMNFEAFGDYWLQRRDLEYTSTLVNDSLFIHLLSPEVPTLNVSMVIKNGLALSGIQLTDADFEPIAFYTQAWKNQDLLLRFGAPILKNSQTTAIEKMVDETGFQLFPNPASEVSHFVYNMPESGDVMVQVSDLKGMLVWKKEFKAQSGQGLLRIPVGTLESGLYMVRFQSATQNKTFKLIKE